MRGLAVSAVAAGVLQTEVGIPADTIAKLVLVGDHRQLGAVESGGLCALLARHHAAELVDVPRFTHAWERAGSIALRDHDLHVRYVNSRE